jgi:hypothetical protein
MSPGAFKQLRSEVRTDPALSLISQGGAVPLPWPFRGQVLDCRFRSRRDIEPD